MVVLKGGLLNQYMAAWKGGQLIDGCIEEMVH